MTAAATHYDVIIIGSGPGGGSVAQRLAPTGKSILILERGDYLPRERENWDATSVFVANRYQAKEIWQDGSGHSFKPGLHYFVGGNSKVYGAALLRMRREDFGEIEHSEGVSPAWPLDYDTFAPFYDEAERLFHVHGQSGEDPCEPTRAMPFPYPAAAHEPAIAALSDDWRRQGLHPFHLPLGVLLEEKDGGVTHDSPCIRCNAFDGFPCLLDAKADAQVICIDPTLKLHRNVTLLTGAFVTHLTTGENGREIDGVHVKRNGGDETYRANLVVVACGALSSALLLLRSADEKHPRGLANGSDQLGRNYMRHNQSVLMALTQAPITTSFQKTLALSDFYLRDGEWNYPLGLIQMCATTHAAQICGEALPSWLQWLPHGPFALLARHALDFWLSSEDLPDPANRIVCDGKQVVLNLRPNNMEAHRRLRGRLQQILRNSPSARGFLGRSHTFRQSVPIAGTAHQAGTARFGADAARNVLDLDCRTHEIDNLYLADASFFPSIGAVNPTLTIIANALRVADKIKSRL